MPNNMQKKYKFNQVGRGGAPIRVSARTRYLVPILAFLLPMFFLGVVSFFDADKQISDKENRGLAKRPVAAWSNVFSGKFSSDFETYYNDQFPFRNLWLDFDAKMQVLFKGVGGDQEIVVLDKKDDFGGQALHDESSQPTPDDPNPSSDAGAPESTESVGNGVKDEDITEEKNYIIIDKKTSRAMELYTNVKAKNAAYAQEVSRLARNLPGKTVYCMVAPTALEFYASEKYRVGNKSQKTAIDELYASLTDGVKPVDAYTPISKHTSEYLYFRSDHHWTQLGAYYAHTAFAGVAGYKPGVINPNTPSGKLEGFLGSLFRSTQSSVLSDKPDTVQYWQPMTPCRVEYFNDVSMQNGKSISLITTNITNKSMLYLSFLEGDHPLVRINTDVKNGRSILVVKESYGNAIVPFLVENYENIYVIDPRKLKTNIPSFVSANDIGEVLCINYIFVPTNKEYMSAFSTCIG